MSKNQISGASVARFADVEVLRYHVEGFEELPLERKLLIYHLSEAALAGRDIIFDQNGIFNLRLRHIFGTIVHHYKGDRTSEDFAALRIYAYRMWFASGIHHHYSSDKFAPEFSVEYFRSVMAAMQNRGYLMEYDEKDREELETVLFDVEVMSKRTHQENPNAAVEHSAVNFYESGVQQQEVEDFYVRMQAVATEEERKSPISYGLNSRLAHDADGTLYEQTYSASGLYAPAIRRIVGHLRAAIEYSASESQVQAIRHLIRFYESGNLQAYNDFCVSWVHSTEDAVDFINGFTETYADPLGMKGSWEGLVHFRNEAAMRRTQLLGENAKWFEAHAPIDERFKKVEPVGITAGVVNMAVLSGDSYPATPIGINLPNADWIRAKHGSKSITIENIHQAYDDANRHNGMDMAFVPDAAVREMLAKYGSMTDRLHTDLHECLGHGSGQLLPGTSPDALGVCSSTIEEARADLFALYFVADAKMQELGLLPDAEAFHVCYYRYFLNGLITQLVRIRPGNKLEEAHMKNRALISHYVLERAGESRAMYLDGIQLVIRDYEALRRYIGELLAEIQRIKSEGDMPAAIRLVEQYGTSVDADIHQEVLRKYASLGLAPYKGFVNPIYRLQTDAEGRVKDVAVDYSEGYEPQMLRYDYAYGTLPHYPVADYLFERECTRPEENVRQEANRLRKKLHLAMDGVVAATMRLGGLDYKYNFGLTRQHLKRLADETPHSAELARFLMLSEVRDLRLIATWLMPVQALSHREATFWAERASEETEWRDYICMNLLAGSPEASHWAVSWALSERLPLQRMGLTLLARLAFMQLLSVSEAVADSLMDLSDQIMTDEDSDLHALTMIWLKRYGQTGKVECQRVNALIAPYATAHNPRLQEVHADISFHLEYECNHPR